MVDQKYIDVIVNENSLRFQLTDYARENADECLLKFAVNSVAIIGEKCVNYGKTYLSKSDKKLLEQYDAIIPADLKRNIDVFAKEDCLLNKMTTYGETLSYHLFMDNRDTPVQVKAENGEFSYEANRIIDIFEEKSGLSSTMIKRYLNNDSSPKLDTALRICFELGLDETQSRDMLKKAGHYIDAPIAENIVCKLLFRLPKKQAEMILNNLKPCIEHIKELSTH